MSEEYFNKLGGRACFERVHIFFCGKLLSHSWLKGFFAGKDRDHLEIQQTDFMSGLLGGPGFSADAPRATPIATCS